MCTSRISHGSGERIVRPLTRLGRVRYLPPRPAAEAKVFRRYRRWEQNFHSPSAPTRWLRGVDVYVHHQFHDK
jgi:hypothetical protein